MHKIPVWSMASKYGPPPPKLEECLNTLQKGKEAMHSGFPKEGDENFQISGHQNIFSRVVLQGLAHGLQATGRTPKTNIRSI